MTKEFDERNAAKSRKVCEAMAEAASTGKRVLTERERHILDMWPRFEDGEYVWFGDRYEDWDGLKKEVAAVQFERDEHSLLDRDGFHTCFSFGKGVKRPAPEDSWERLEEDVNAIVTGDGMYHRLNDYCNGHGLGGDDVIALTVCDIVRRAKALAGVEVAE